MGIHTWIREILSFERGIVLGKILLDGIGIDLTVKVILDVHVLFYQRRGGLNTIVEMPFMEVEAFFKTSI